MIYSKELIQLLEEKARILRRDVIISIGVGVAGHIGGSNSSADLVTALYFYKMKYDPKNPQTDALRRRQSRTYLRKNHRS
jgi:transketolase